MRRDLAGSMETADYTCFFFRLNPEGSRGWYSRKLSKRLPWINNVRCTPLSLPSTGDTGCWSRATPLELAPLDSYSLNPHPYLLPFSFVFLFFFSIATIATPLFSFIRSLRLLHLVEPMLVPHADWTPVISITLVRLLWHQAFSVSDDQYWCDSSGERLVWTFEIFFASSNASSTNRKIRS